MKILVLNSGSSSLKFDLWETTPELIASDSDVLLAQGNIERVTSLDDALAEVFKKIGDHSIPAVGHRIVQGGDRFPNSVLIDEKVEKGIEELGILAPLHNPHNLAVVRAAKKHLPDAQHVAVFDTSFHQTLAEHAYAYALPYDDLTQKKIRRYGFHGISYRYVSERFVRIQKTQHARDASQDKLIICHLGNGCSICAVRAGKSVDTSMGFTPLEGLIMGTRVGDIDASAILYLITHEKQDPEALLRTLNEESGLKGLSGISNDMRDIEKKAASGVPRAKLAMDAFCYRARKYIGSYLAAMNGADAIIFTGGIGEHAVGVRAQICADLNNLGITIDAALNAAERKDDRQVGNGQIPVWVIPTNEELIIARDTLGCILAVRHD